MSKINKVVASPNGQIFRNSAKNIKPRKRERFNRSEEPKSCSDKIQEFGNYKNARVMRAGGNDKTVSFRGGEYKHTPEKPKRKHDSRCHPHWR